MDSSDAHSDQNGISDGDVPGDPNRVEFQDSSKTRSSLVGGARYKLMSPAKLPISRATCITIPPGLSPSSFLESPVLLTNMKAEPSPTTGTFIKSHMVHGYSSSGTYPISTSVFSNSGISEEGKASVFDFKPPMKANMVSADLNGHRSEQSVQVQVYGFSAPAEFTGTDVNQRLLTNPEVQATEFDHKGSGASMAAERSSDDGYNWRKYGQKHVKGSEFPRSYYKCTHPNCEVKKLFERSHDGQITEIIYKGTHDHPKPQPSRRCTSSNIMSMQEERLDKPTSLPGQPGQDDKPTNRYSHNFHSADPNVASEHSLVVATDDSIEGSGSMPNKNHDEADEDDPFSKKRRMEAGGFEVTPVIKPIREPRVVVQTLSEVDILDDGYRWRKYGQKVVRGNPNPRSYYKCTNVGCPVRKHVERASHNPKAVITTYEGKHNHDVPTAKSSSHDTAGPPSMACPSKFRAEEVHAISLDLEVGISNPTENRSNDYGQTGQYELSHRQTLNGSSNFRVVQATPVSTHFSVLNGGISEYGSRENEITPLSHSSYPYPQNIGRILTGP